MSFEILSADTREGKPHYYLDSMTEKQFLLQNLDTYTKDQP